MTKQIKIAISLITLFSSCFFAFSVSGSSITAHAQETEADEEDSIYNYFTP